jgi:ketosteroid isomerase-like protein
MDSRAFEAATDAFHQALRTNDVAALFVHVQDDVVMIPPGEPVVRGERAMREWYAGFLSVYHTSSLTLTDKEVFVSDDWAVEIGAYEWGLTPASGGDAVVDVGHYMQLWKPDADGRWKFAREIWNSASPSAAQ